MILRKLAMMHKILGVYNIRIRGVKFVLRRRVVSGG